MPLRPVYGSCELSYNRFMKGIEAVQSVEACTALLPKYASGAFCLGLVVEYLDPGLADMPDVILDKAEENRVPRAAWELAYLVQSVLPPERRVPRAYFTLYIEEHAGAIQGGWHCDGVSEQDGPNIIYVKEGEVDLEVARADELLDQRAVEVGYRELPYGWQDEYDQKRLVAGNAAIIQGYHNPTAGLVGVHHRCLSPGYRRSLSLFGPRDKRQGTPGPINWL
jgi:hypothetical protein